jgi:hypothetical protein
MLATVPYADMSDNLGEGLYLKLRRWNDLNAPAWLCRPVMTMFHRPKTPRQVRSSTALTIRK